VNCQKKEEEKEEKKRKKEKVRSSINRNQTDEPTTPQLCLAISLNIVDPAAR
jgi:hypothetical protein